LQRLQERVEEWRRRRPHRTAMPAALWSEAVVLADREGAYRVARALRINFEGLKRRIAESAVGGTAASPAFVELPARAVVEALPAAGAIVEMQDRDGTHVVLRLAKDAPVDVAQLISAFRGRGA